MLRVRISVVHRDFATDGGGERVTLSLLRALDRTGHDVDLRCFCPPQNASFRKREGGRDDSMAAWPAPDAGRPLHEFRRVRLRSTSAAIPAAASPSEVRSLFARTESDLLIVTDGGFVMERTDTPRVLLYANSDLSGFCEGPTLRRLCNPRRLLQLYRCRRTLRRMLALVRDPRVAVIPNSKSTARAYETAAGGGSGGVRLGRVVYPPVDLGRFAAAATRRRRPRERRVVTTGRFSLDKCNEVALRVMLRVGSGWDAVGNARGSSALDYLGRLRSMAGPGMRFHVNASEDELDALLGGARVYLHPRPESFGIAVVEAVAAGCVPVVPDNSAHPETVPFAELRYRTEAEAVEIVRGALDGKYDGLLPALREHVQRFSEEAFQEAMLGIIDGRKGGGGGAAQCPLGPFPTSRRAVIAQTGGGGAAQCPLGPFPGRRPARGRPAARRRCVYTAASGARRGRGTAAGRGLPPAGLRRAGFIPRGIRPRARRRIPACPEPRSRTASLPARRRRGAGTGRGPRAIERRGGGNTLRGPPAPSARGRPAPPPSAARPPRAGSGEGRDRRAAPHGRGFGRARQGAGRRCE